MIDKLLGFGSMFDWITPSVAFVQDAVYGPSTAYFVPYDTGWSAGEIKRLLQRHGIKVWGLMIVGHEIMFSTRQSQARHALYILEERNGIPVTRAGPLPGEKKSGRGWLGRMMYK